MVAALALMVDAALVARPWGPPATIARLLDGLRKRLDRARRPTEQRTLRGALVLLAGAMLAILIGMAVLWASRNLPLAWLAEVILLALVVGQRGAFTIGRRAVAALERGKGRNQTQALALTAADRLAQRFADGPMAMVLWLAVLGLPGVLLHRVVGWIAADGAAPAPYGRAAVLAHRLLLAPPALLTGALGLVVALGLPGARPDRGLGALLLVRRVGPDLAILPVRAALSVDTAEAGALRRLRRTLALYGLMSLVLILACWGAGIALWVNPPRP